MLSTDNATKMKAMQDETSHLRSVIEAQNSELEVLHEKFKANEESNKKITPQQLHVKSYLAGVQMNLTQLEKQNAQLEQEMSDLPLQ